VALQRARDKLDIVRGNLAGDLPAGANSTKIALGFAIAGIPALLFFVLGASLLGDNANYAGAMILFVLAALVMAIPCLILFTGRPNTPVGALKAFYGAVSGGNAERARRLVTNADFDTTERRQPLITDLGRPGGQGLRFADPRQFAIYWDELLRTHPSPYCLARVSGAKVRMVARDVAVIDYKLKLIMNTRLWLLLIFVALLLAVIVDIATQKRVKAQLRKVAVKVGDEWKLLNGEWQGYEDFDLRWLDGA
jgi:hypothetical protein